MGRPKKWTQEKLDILYECWKEGNDVKERIKLIEKALPDVALPKALAMMRKLARTDTKWLRWNTRKNNEKEKEKLEKKQAREQRRIEADQKRKERIFKKKQREEQEAEKKVKTYLNRYLDLDCVKEIQDKVDFQFFFCPDVIHYVNTHSCIFRVFGNEDKYGFAHGGPCGKCVRMDKYIPVIKEVVDARQKTKRDTSGKRRQIEKQNKKTENRTRKTRGRKRKG